MADIHELKPRAKVLNEQTIKLAKHLLEEAEAGNIVSIAYAAVRDDGSTDTATSASDSFTQVLGAIDILHFRMLSGREAVNIGSPE